MSDSTTQFVMHNAKREVIFMNVDRFIKTESKWALKQRLELIMRSYDAVSGWLQTVELQSYTVKVLLKLEREQNDLTSLPLGVGNL